MKLHPCHKRLKPGDILVFKNMTTQYRFVSASKETILLFSLYTKRETSYIINITDWLELVKIIKAKK